jgi:cytochrome c2
MKDEKQPYRTHPGDYLTHHPSEQFGRTICHRGQGRALVFADAKGDEAYLDYPILPIHLTQSSCGLCHSAEEVANYGGEKYALGKQLFESKGCFSCHNLYGRGGNMGPKLDNEGLKIKHVLPMIHVEGPHTLPQWLVEHFDDPQKIVANSQMKPPNLSEEEREALTTYILSLQERDIPQSYVSSGKLLELYKQKQPDPSTVLFCLS